MGESYFYFSIAQILLNLPLMVKSRPEADEITTTAMIAESLPYPIAVAPLSTLRNVLKRLVNSWPGGGESANAIRQATVVVGI